MNRILQLSMLFIILIIFITLIYLVMEARAEPGEKIVDSFTDDIAKGRFNGAYGTEVTGISWVAVWADGAAEITFWDVQYNGSGAEYDTIPDPGNHGLGYYSIRYNLPKLFQFTQHAYVDSYRIININASEVMLTWQE